jgi:lysophospholipase L1-like esterase
VFFAVHRLPAGDAPRRSRGRESSTTPLEEGLRLLRELQQQRGFAALVFLLPGLDGPYDRYAHRDRHLRMAAVARRVGGIEWIDLLDGVAGAKRNLRLLSFDGMHPNRVGQVVLADRIFRELRRRGLP